MRVSFDTAEQHLPSALRFTESVAASMTLPPQARLERARALNRKYSRLIALLIIWLHRENIGRLMRGEEA